MYISERVAELSFKAEEELAPVFRRIDNIALENTAEGRVPVWSLGDEYEFVEDLRCLCLRFFTGILLRRSDRGLDLIAAHGRQYHDPHMQDCIDAE